MTAATVLGRRPAVTGAWWWCAAFLAGWAALLGMVLTSEGLTEDDGPVLRWLVQHRSSGWTRFFKAVSGTVPDGGAAMLATALVAVVALRSRSVRPIGVLVAAVAGAGLLSVLVKDVVGRARPATATMLGAPESGPGFPSAHTLVFTALAGAVALVVWRATASAGVRAVSLAGAVVTSGAMGVSRLYLGDHWCTDVLASYALAGAVLAAVAALVRPARG